MIHSFTHNSRYLETGGPVFVVFMMMIEFVIPCDPELIKVTYYSVYENTV